MQGENNNVGDHVQRQLHIEIRGPSAHHHPEHQRQGEIGRADIDEQRQVVAAQVERVAVEKHRQQEKHRYRNTIEVEIPQRTPK